MYVHVYIYIYIYIYLYSYLYTYEPSHKGIAGSCMLTGARSKSWMLLTHEHINMRSTPNFRLKLAHESAIPIGAMRHPMADTDNVQGR